MNIRLFILTLIYENSHFYSVFFIIANRISFFLQKREAAIKKKHKRTSYMHNAANRTNLLHWMGLINRIHLQLCGTIYKNLTKLKNHAIQRRTKFACEPSHL